MVSMGERECVCVCVLLLGLCVCVCVCNSHVPKQKIPQKNTDEKKSEDVFKNVLMALH